VGKTVYVGNMSHEIGDARLTELFAVHGDVVEVRVVTDRYTDRPRGFAFVDMATEEGARTAISELDGQAVDGRQLRVAEAKPRRRRDPDRDLYTSHRGW
jgi:RNA recognition motif-containing protein